MYSHMVASMGQNLEENEGEACGLFASDDEEDKQMLKEATELLAAQRTERLQSIAKK